MASRRSGCCGVRRSGCYGVTTKRGVRCHGGAVGECSVLVEQRGLRQRGRVAEEQLLLQRCQYHITYQLLKVFARNSMQTRSLEIKHNPRQQNVAADDLAGRMSGNTVLIQDAMGEKVGKFIQLMASFVGGFVIAKTSSRGQAAYAEAAVVVEQAIRLHLLRAKSKPLINIISRSQKHTLQASMPILAAELYSVRTALILLQQAQYGEDCQQRIRALSTVRVLHVPRCANKLAHLLCQYAKKSDYSLYVKYNPPDCVLSMLADDVPTL